MDRRGLPPARLGIVCDIRRALIGGEWVLLAPAALTAATAAAAGIAAGISYRRLRRPARCAVVRKTQTGREQGRNQRQGRQRQFQLEHRIHLLSLVCERATQEEADVAQIFLWG